MGRAAMMTHSFILVNLEILDKYPALVLHYSEGVLLLLRFRVIIIYCALN
jgi:hypothetical protein